MGFLRTTVEPGPTESVEFGRDERGITAISIALLTASLIGVVGLGVEAGMWFTDHRALQMQADAAALAGAFRILANDSANITSAATAEASNNGYADGGPNSIVITPASTQVTATLTSQKTPTFLSVLSTAAVNVQATATAQVQTLGNPCFLALDTTSGDTGIGSTGTASLSMPHCLLASNTPGANSIDMKGTSSLSVGELYAVGAIGEGSNTTVTSDLPPLAGQPAITVPSVYTNLSITAPTCNQSLPSGSSPISVPANVCYKSMDFGPNPYALQSGIYYVKETGKFDVKSNTTLTGTGVTIILLSNGNNTAGATINGNATVTLSAPTSGSYKGILFFQDPSAKNSPSNQIKLDGGANQNLTGAIYSPKNSVEFTGNIGSGGCLFVVAYQISLKGNSTISTDDSSCASAGVKVPTVQKVVLIN